MKWENFQKVLKFVNLKRLVTLIQILKKICKQSLQNMLLEIRYISFHIFFVIRRYTAVRLNLVFNLVV